MNACAGYLRINIYFGHLVLFVLLYIASMRVLIAQDQKSETATSTILFVCEHGAARSAIASAYFNKLAHEKGLSQRAAFRGTDPDTILTAGTARGLVKDGFDIKNYKPVKVDQGDLDSAFQVITFDCTLPEEMKLEKPILRWDGVPPISKDYDEARDQIKQKVEALVEELVKLKKRKR